HASANNIMVWTFVASLDTGSMAGKTFPVCYSYDADQVAPVGESYVQLNSLEFTLGDAQFTRNDIFQGGQVIFSDGVAQNVTASFQVFMPPNSPVTNITFGFGGDGVIGYIDLSYQYGDGSFALSSQTPGCSGPQPSPLPSPSVYGSPSRMISPSRTPMVSPSPSPTVNPTTPRRPKPYSPGPPPSHRKSSRCVSHEQGPPRSLQRRRHRHPHHYHGARPAVAAQRRPVGARNGPAGPGDVSAELR